MNNLREKLAKFKKFKNFVGPEVLRLLYCAIFAGAFLFAAESSFIFVMQGFLFNIGVVAKESLKLPTWYPTGLRASIIILILFGFCRAIAFFLKTYLAGMVNQVFMRGQRTKIVRLSLNHAFEISTQEAVSMFTEYVSNSGAVLQLILTLLLTFTSSFLLFVLGLKIAPIPMLIGVVFLGLLAFPLKKYDRIIDKSGMALIKDWDQVSTTLIQGIRQNFFLKVYGLIPGETEKASVSLNNFVGHQRRYFYSYAAKTALPPFFGILILAVIAYTSVKFFSVPGPVLLAFFYLFVRLTQTGSEAYSGFGMARFYFHYLKALYYWQQKLDQLTLKVRLPQLQPENLSKLENEISKQGVEIEARNLSFKYEGNSKWLLKDLSFKLGRGECLVITGGSGTGKSTLLSLILGMNSASEGSIRVNGESIEKMQAPLFKQVGYIGPEPYLIGGTIFDNLLYGQSNPQHISQQDIWHALEISNAKGFVSELPEREKTFLNEHAKISTGQKQRLAIARAFLRRPQLLIMDECTSNLDAINEGEIISSIVKMKPEMTTIIVTHRPAFKEIATQLINLEGEG